MGYSLTLPSPHLVLTQNKPYMMEWPVIHIHFTYHHKGYIFSPPSVFLSTPYSGGFSVPSSFLLSFVFLHPCLSFLFVFSPPSFHPYYNPSQTFSPCLFHPSLLSSLPPSPCLLYIAFIPVTLASLDHFCLLHSPSSPSHIHSSLVSSSHSFIPVPCVLPLSSTLSPLRQPLLIPLVDHH